MIDNETADGLTESFLTLSTRGGRPIKHMRHLIDDRPFLTPGLIDMTAAVLPADPNVHAAYVRALERMPVRLPGHGYETTGLEELREAMTGASQAVTTFEVTRASRTTNITTNSNSSNHNR